MDYEPLEIGIEPQKKKYIDYVIPVCFSIFFIVQLIFYITLIAYLAKFQQDFSNIADNTNIFLNDATNTSGVVHGAFKQFHETAQKVDKLLDDSIEAIDEFRRLTSTLRASMQYVVQAVDSADKLFIHANKAIPKFVNTSNTVNIFFDEASRELPLIINASNMVNEFFYKAYIDMPFIIDASNMVNEFFYKAGQEIPTINRFFNDTDKEIASTSNSINRFFNDTDQDLGPLMRNVTHTLTIINSFFDNANITAAIIDHFINGLP